MKARIAYRDGSSLLGVDGPIVVIDALRMSATTIVACSLGLEVIPVATVEEAMEWGARGAITAGERDGWKVPTLDIGNSPTALRALDGLLPRRLALTTTNGVPALLSVIGHPHEVLIGSPLNLSALAAQIGGAAELGILIAGRRGPEAEEDEITAALLLERLGVNAPPGLPAPVPAAALPDRFAHTRSGRKLSSRGETDDVALCGRVDLYRIVPRVVQRDPYPIIAGGNR